MNHVDIIRWAAVTALVGTTFSWWWHRRYGHRIVNPALWFGFAVFLITASYKLWVAVTRPTNTTWIGRETRNGDIGNLVLIAVCAAVILVHRAGKRFHDNARERVSEERITTAVQKAMNDDDS